MIDMTFIRTLEYALTSALSSASAGGLADKSCGASGSAEMTKVCKQAAQRLFFELDGLALIDLGMAKLAAEQQGGLTSALRMPPPAARRPENPRAAA